MGLIAHDVRRRSLLNVHTITQGTHDDLISKNGAYAALVRKQLSRQAKVVEHEAVSDADVIDKILDQIGDISAGTGLPPAAAVEGDDRARNGPAGERPSSPAKLWRSKKDALLAQIKESPARGDRESPAQAHGERYSIAHLRNRISNIDMLRSIANSGGERGMEEAGSADGVVQEGEIGETRGMSRAEIVELSMSQDALDDRAGRHRLN
jgi:hypothetical protein